jgi:DNA topoisomerase I
MAEPARGWWRREGSAAEGFRYLRTGGQPLRAEPALRRIDRLRIPPAWTEVRIAPVAGRKVQAWGYDQAGRRQYIYSDGHVAERELRKWKRLLRVGRLLPRLRAVTNADLQRPKLDSRKALATVVRLICRGYFRAGSERYAVANRTFGICTLKKSHVRIAGNDLFFSYAGKRGIHQHQVVAETPLVEIVRELSALRGARLFQYRDEEGRIRPVTARAVNDYLRDAVDERFTSKDLRTFGGTLRAALVLAELGPAATRQEAKRNVALTCRLVASELGNTPAICRAAYIHPAVLEQYERHCHTLRSADRREAERPIEAEEPVGHYPEEAVLLRFLERYG